ncbi:MAG: hypothetical protein ACYTGL_31230, partial [Planctomycetota bacterium]
TWTPTHRTEKGQRPAARYVDVPQGERAEDAKQSWASVGLSPPSFGRVSRTYQVSGGSADSDTPLFKDPRHRDQ